MKIDLSVLKNAIQKLDYSISDYNGEKITDVEISIQDENIQGNKLGDIVVIKCTTHKVNKYDNNSESTIVRILEIPGASENLGKKYNLTTQTVESFDLEKKTT